MKRIFNNKKTASVAIAGAVALTLMGSMAYFTDYATTQANGTAGTVAIAMDSDINLLDANGMDILNPGDQRDGSFAITNMGNKSIDVRTTMALTALDHEGNPINFTGDAESQSEYDLYLASDVEVVEGQGVKPKADAKPLAVKSVEGNVIKYILPEYSLNGNSDEYAEVETIDGIDTFSHENDFVLVFKGEAGNEWQASSIQLDVIVEAKQHENTGAGWNIVAQENVTAGSLSQNVVMAETVITPVGGESDGGAETPAVDAEGFTIVDETWTVSGTMRPIAIRDAADPYGNQLASVPNGFSVNVIGKRDDGWFKVIYQDAKYGEITGYMQNTYLVQGGGASKPEAPVTPGTPADANPDKFVAADEIVQYNAAYGNLNIRELPSSTSAPIGQLPIGVEAKRIGMSPDGGWSKIEYNGIVGYCYSSYLTVVQ